ncbi:hypothetical protein [Nocardia noduli]|nr:hypothetical protein [Nocardia noduli]
MLRSARDEPDCPNLLARVDGARWYLDGACLDLCVSTLRYWGLR